jgi:hypothetical protein
MARRTSKFDFTYVSKAEDQPKLRDKDNAQPRVKPPAGVTRPAYNLAPPGMSGIKTGSQPRVQQRPEPERKQPTTSIDNGKDQSLWIDGKITSMKGYEFKARLYDEPSNLGIDGGKISKLDVRKDGELVMRYDQGWAVDPKTPVHKEALYRIRNGLDDTPHKDFKGFDRKDDKDHGFDR